MEAKFKVGDRFKEKPDSYIAVGLSKGWIHRHWDECWKRQEGEADETFIVTRVSGEYVIYSNKIDGRGPQVHVDHIELITPAITIGSTWYWQGEKDSPVTVIGFDSKGQIVFEFGFDDDLSGRRKGEVISYLSDEKEFTTRYTSVPNKPKPKKLTGYVRVLKPSEGYFFSEAEDDHIFQSAVFSDEAKARAAVPYGFEVVDVVKVEWDEK